MTIRISGYGSCIRLHSGDAHLLIHGYTGAVDLADGRVATALQSGRIGELTDGERAQLLRRGYLTAKTEDEERAFAAALFRARFRRRNGRESFVFLLSYNCNFRCAYCFQRDTQNRGDALLAATASPEMLESAFRFIDRSGAPAHLTLYGGEPFLASNAAAVEQVVRFARERRHRVTAVSNGYQLDRFLPLLGDGGIESVQVTIDGPAEVHDRRRPSLGGGGTFHRIVTNVRGALERGAAVTMRVNLDDENITRLPELVASVKAGGLFGFPAFRWDVTPVANLAIGSKLTTLAYADFHAAVEELRPRLRADGIPEPAAFYQHLRAILRDALRSGGPLRYQPRVCNAYSHMWVFDPLGNLYACWDVVDDADYCIGTYHPTVAIDEERLAIWRGRADTVVAACGGCRYLLFCGGGCQKKAIVQWGSPHAHDCSEFPQVFEAQMRAAYEELAASSANDHDFADGAIAADSHGTSGNVRPALLRDSLDPLPTGPASVPRPRIPNIPGMTT